MDIAFISKAGTGRLQNEDAILVAGEVLQGDQSGARRVMNHSVSCTVIAVADGLGGYGEGQRASRFVLEQLLYAVQDMRSPNEKELEELCKKIDRELYHLSYAEKLGKPSTTLSAVVIFSSQAAVVSVGDSRVYSGAYKLEQLTRDHIIRINNKRTITSSLGFGPAQNLEVWIKILQLPKSKHTFLVCTDGVYNRINVESELMVSSGESPSCVVEKIESMSANEDFTDDYSAVIVDVGGP